MQKLAHFSSSSIIGHDEIDLLLKEAFDTQVRDVKEARNMAEKALKLSESIEYEKGITYAYSYLGFF